MSLRQYDCLVSGSQCHRQLYSKLNPIPKLGSHLETFPCKLFQRFLLSRERQPFFIVKSGHVLIPACSMDQVLGRGLVKGFKNSEVCLGGTVA